jgi:subtilisin family serine protease
MCNTYGIEQKLLVKLVSTLLFSKNLFSIMKRKFTTLFALILFFSFNAHSQDFYYSPEGKTNLQVSTQKILIQFNSSADFDLQKQILSEHQEIIPLTRDMMLPAPQITLVDLQNVSSSEDVYTLLEKIKSNPNVEYANHFLAHKDGTLHGVMDRILVGLKDVNQFLSFENAMKKNPLIERFSRNQFDPLLMEVKVSGLKNALEVANSLHESQEYAFAEPDFLRLMKRMNTNDPNVDDQWSLNNDGVNTSQYGGVPGADMKVFAAWNSTTGSSTIKVAIIDEGVDLNHPDLVGNLLGGYDATGQGSGGGPSGDDAHGTACAGIVAAVGNNSLGGVGVAYTSKIIPVRIAYSSGTSWVTNNTWIANALNWSWQTANADVLSNSWGGGGSSSSINGAIDGAVNNGRGGLGAPVLFAAGNDNGANSYPATYAPTISVIAMSMCNQRKNPSSCDGETWWGSNYGSGADLAAPGVKIFATDISGSAGYSSGDYVTNFNGTSSACPNAAGVMALVLSANGSLTEDQARAALESTTDKVGGYSYSNVGGQPNGTWSNDLGYGRINADAAVSSVSSSTTNDAGINSVTSPTGSICASSDSPVVVLRNYGSNTLTSVTINYSLDGGSNNTYSWSGSLAQNATANVTLPSLSFGNGNHTFDVSTSDPNGQVDANTANDGVSSSFSSGSNSVTLSITFDNYPEETSWDIKDGGGATVASGGTYGSQADGSTLVIPLCLADGCFDFTIYDVYGDGICCGFGNGSYTLTEDASATVLANGGSFTYSEITNFCVPINTGSNVDVSISSSIDVSCNGLANGSATASGTGGNGSITYSWSNGVSGTTASGLAAGTYTVTATDGTTSSSVSVSIIEPSAIGGTVTGTNPTTGNSDGSATVSVSGGTPGYTYNWSNGGNAATINSLSAGTYTISVTDANGCEATGSITLIEETGGGCTYVTIDANGFESGWGIWNDGGSDSRRRANDNQYATAGTYCIRLRDNTSTSTMSTDNLNLTSYDEVTIDFGYYPRSMDNSNEDFWLQVSTNGGASYATVEEWNRGDEFQNNIFYTDAVVIPGPFTSTTRFRFRADASGNSDWVYIDEVVITGCTTTPNGSGAGGNYDPKVLADENIEEVEEVEKTIQELNLFPNPTNNILNVAFELTNNSDVKMMVMSLTGQIVEMRDLKLEEGTQQFRVDVNRFDGGIYFIHLITKDERISKKFIVTN